MPALDSMMGGGAIHIADQNKEKPIKTLCGQALDKDTTRYFMNRENFTQATCKVCRGIYYDESWNGEANSRTDSTNVQDPPAEEQQAQDPQQEQPEQSEQQEETPVVRTNLFANLQKPVNVHREQPEN